MFAYTLGRLCFSNWISLVWNGVLCGKTLQSDLALIVLGLEKKTRPHLDTASQLSARHPSSTVHPRITSKAETHTADADSTVWHSAQSHFASVLRMECPYGFNWEHLIVACVLNTWSPAGEILGGF